MTKEIDTLCNCIIDRLPIILNCFGAKKERDFQFTGRIREGLCVGPTELLSVNRTGE
jgi:hypothetical protein